MWRKKVEVVTSTMKESDSPPKSEKQDKTLRVGQRVEIPGRDAIGTVAYIGTALFSPGKWVGVVLDEAKGKNNGTVMGKAYFSCKENHGVFVRQSQLVVLEDQTPSSTITSPAGGPPQTGTVNTPTAVKSRVPKGPRTGRLQKRLSMITKTPGAASPTVSLTTVTPTPSSDGTESLKPELGSKRASFIETGFIETFKAQFKPGAPVSPSLSLAIEEQGQVSVIKQELDNYRTEIKDLNEKLETLKVKRSQDKEKLKEFEKMKIQLDQLLEFKRAILESQSQLQKELQRWKQEAREAVEAKERHEEETTEMVENFELATLDKEMAEEKAETLQIELDQARQRVEELQLDLDILRAEVSECGSDGAGAVFQIKQLEQQNHRLKETLVKLRDVSALDKQELMRTQKELEQKKNEVNELVRSNKALNNQLDTVRSTIIELQEQVDAALGAESMVEQLTERNLLLEDKIAELEEAVSDLEQLQDLNEELQENAREMELELREELDMAQSKTREALRVRDALQEMASDREQTILKFRDLVQKLQEQNQELRNSLEKETNKPVTPTEIIDFKKIYSETRAQAKSIDLELRKLDANQAVQHVQYLCAFMPDSFLSRGGEYDSLQVLLLIPRFLWKAEIIAGQLKERFPQPEKIDRETAIKTQAAERYSYCRKVLQLLFSLQGILHQFSTALNTCSPETYLKMGGLLSEMIAHEKSLDFYIDLLRKDQLDENVTSEPLEKCFGYFTNLYPVHLQDEKINSNLFLQDEAKIAQAVCECIEVDVSRMKVVMQSGNEGSDVSIILRDLESGAKDLGGVVRKIKRRLPQDGSSSQINLNAEIRMRIVQSVICASKVAKFLQTTAKLVTQHAAVLVESETGVPAAKMREFIVQACYAIYDRDDNAALESVVAGLRGSFSAIDKIAQCFVDGEYDFDGTPEQKAPAPVTLRAQHFKAEMKNLESLRSKIEQKEQEIRDLRALIKLKQEEVSELNIRRDLSDKKLNSTLKDAELSIERLNRKLEDAEIMLARKDKEFEETIEHLQQDLKEMEIERNELKEKNLALSKRIVFESIAKGSVSSGPLVSAPIHAASITTPQTTPASSRDLNLLQSQVMSLTEALRHSRREATALRAADMKQKLAALTPIKIIGKSKNIESRQPLEAEFMFPKIQLLSRKKKQDESQIPENIKKRNDTENTELQEIAKRSSTILSELYNLTAYSKIVDITKRQPGFNFLSERLSPAYPLSKHQAKVKTLQREILRLQNSIATIAAHRRSSSVLYQPTNEKADELRARLQFPGIEGGSETIHLTQEELRAIHLKLAP
ncbi:dynactin subunit 1-like isoform X4 [Artemia franciscana]|uniref:dynactin subunit 1-like isoform X4 n=1 Tax=Artemia franciscana TaxID=6661 RepID=UPI0032DAF3EA